MKNKKIILAGGTGFMGQEMTKYFGKENKIIILTRQVSEKTNRNDYDSLSASDLKNVSYIKWDGKTVSEWANEMNEADLVINLAGKSVNCRYNEKNKN
ncbi:MAG TPA: NAD-dependent epimerase/dehydratase family protein, partial [Chitinophagaceae bacterium]